MVKFTTFYLEFPVPNRPDIKKAAPVMGGFRFKEVMLLNDEFFGAGCIVNLYIHHVDSACNTV